MKNLAKKNGKKDLVVGNISADLIMSNAGKGLENITSEDIILTKADNPSKYYESYLGFLKGNILSAMYDKFSTRLLERNVRLYLQARSKVNKGEYIT